VLERYRHARLHAFEYRHQASPGGKVVLAFAMAGLTALAAQVRVPVPFSPVPVTGQTFAVLLSGLLLGRRWGGISQALYVVVGVGIGLLGGALGLSAAGVPWFAPGTPAGLAALAGPTGGYLVGFVFAAALVGWITDRYTRARRYPYLLGVLLVANFGVVYAFGLPWLAAYLSQVAGQPVTVRSVLEAGVLPFLAGDAVVLVAAAVAGRALAPQEPFGAERDAPLRTTDGDGD